MATQQSVPAPSAPTAQYLTFSLMGEEYAVGILKVREILEYDTITRIPSTPSWIRGAINLRGSVVPVVDLAVRFGHAATEISRRSCVVILDVEVRGEIVVMGILADSVSQVIDLAASDIEPAPSFGTRAAADDILGMAKAGKKFVLVLDVDHVLSRDEIVTTEAGGNPPAPAVEENQQ